MSKKSMIVLILITLILAATGFVFTKKINTRKVPMENKKTASASQFQLGNLDFDFNTINIAKKEAELWQKDAKLTLFEISRLPGPQELIGSIYWFTSSADLSKGFFVDLDADNIVKDKGEKEITENDFMYSNPIDTQKIKISSAEAFNIAQKIATEFGLPIYENNFLSMGLNFNDKTKSYQWLCSTANYPDTTNPKPKIVMVVINAETGVVDNKLVKEKE